MGSFFKSKPATIQDVTPSEFSALRDPLAATLSQFLAGGSSAGGFPGPFVAPITSEETASINRIRGLTSGAPPTEAAATDLLRRTLSGEFLTPESNPFLEAMFTAAARPVIRNFQDVVQPELRAQFTRGGQFIQPGSSSPFATALARAGTGFTENLTDLAAQIFGPAYQFERGLQQGAVPQAIALGQEPLRRETINLAVQALPREIEQRGIDAAMQNFFQATGLQLDAAQLAALVANPNLVTVPGSPSTFSQITSGLTQAALPFALTGSNPISAVSSLFSAGNSFSNLGSSPFAFTGLQ